MRRTTTMAAAWALVLVAAAPRAGIGASERVHSTVDARRSIALTAYNHDLGLVRDVRVVELPRGESELWFEGVAARIDPTSVAIRALDGDVRVIEQNFRYDLISPKRLMEKYVGRDLELVRYPEGRDGRAERVRARLLATNDGYVYEIGGKIAIDPRGSVELPELPEGLIARPSLVWTLSGGGRRTLEASYLTQGVSWHADYVAVLDGDGRSLDLSGWVTVENHSGASYPHATLKLVAGDVHRAGPEGRVPLRAMAAQESMDQGVREEGLFEYHLYTIERPTTILDNETKQIALLDAGGVSARRRYVYEPRMRFWRRAMQGPESTTKVGVTLEFRNDSKNHLGLALPGGVVRVYQRDRDGALQLVGEDRIDHTPRDETVRVRMGNAFDVVAERTQTDFDVVSSGHAFRSSYRVVVRNHKDEDITVDVIEHPAGDWRIEKSSHHWTKESQSRVRFDVPVKARGEATLTYTVLVRY